MTPLVTVVIPIYNVEKYLDRCVNSIVNQTYKNIEIILVDDGSPDNCPQMCDEWAKKDERIRVVHKLNAGLGMARNSGLEIARGEYLLFIDSDDYLDISTIELCVSSAVHHNSDVVIFGRKDVDDNSVVGEMNIKTNTDIFRGKEVQHTLLPAVFSYKMGFGVSAAGRMYRTDVFEKYNLRFRSEREIISEDAYFALELFSKDVTVSVVRENLYHYYRRSDSLTHTYRADRQLKNDAFLSQCVTLAEKEKLPKQVSTHLMVRYHLYTIAAIKQLMTSSLTKKEKKTALRSIFTNKTFRNTLTKEVLSYEDFNLRMFYYSVKFRCYFICDILLKIKLNKGN